MELLATFKVAESSTEEDVVLELLEETLLFPVYFAIICVASESLLTKVTPNPAPAKTANEPTATPNHVSVFFIQYLSIFNKSQLNLSFNL